MGPYGILYLGSMPFGLTRIIDRNPHAPPWAAGRTDLDAHHGARVCAWLLCCTWVPTLAPAPPSLRMDIQKNLCIYTYTYTHIRTYTHIFTHICTCYICIDVQIHIELVFGSMYNMLKGREGSAGISVRLWVEVVT